MFNPDDFELWNKFHNTMIFRWFLKIQKHRLNLIVAAMPAMVNQVVGSFLASTFQPNESWGYHEEVHPLCLHKENVDYMLEWVR